MFPSILLLLLLKEKAVRTRLHLPPQSPPVPSAADVFAEVQQQMATLPTAATVTTSPARPTRLWKLLAGIPPPEATQLLWRQPQLPLGLNGNPKDSDLATSKESFFFLNMFSPLLTVSNLFSLSYKQKWADDKRWQCERKMEGVGGEWVRCRRGGGERNPPPWNSTCRAANGECVGIQ